MAGDAWSCVSTAGTIQESTQERVSLGQADGQGVLAGQPGPVGGIGAVAGAIGRHQVLVGATGNEVTTGARGDAQGSGPQQAPGIDPGGPIERGAQTICRRSERGGPPV